MGSDDVIAVKIEEAGGGSDEVLEKESGSSDFVCVKIEGGTENERSRGRQGVIGGECDATCQTEQQKDGSSNGVVNYVLQAGQVVAAVFGACGWYQTSAVIDKTLKIFEALKSTVVFRDFEEEREDFLTALEDVAGRQFWQTIYSAGAFFLAAVLLLMMLRAFFSEVFRRGCGFFY